MHCTTSRAILIALTLVTGAASPAMAQSMSNDKAMASDKMMATGMKGSFSGAMNHSVSGSYALTGNGKERKLEFGNDFRMDKASDVYVMLGKGMTKDEGSLELGKLKKTDGSQSYNIPESANLASYSSVLLWSKKDKAVVGEAMMGGHGAMGSMDHGSMDKGAMMDKPAMAKDSGMMKTMAKDTGMMKKP
jgi:hypothetical protein